VKLLGTLIRGPRGEWRGFAHGLHEGFYQGLVTIRGKACQCLMTLVEVVTGVQPM
jgi:hypothetical protein